MSVYNPAAFVATFDNTNHVNLPFYDGVNLTVDWGDGTVEHVTSDRPSHTYPHEGQWTVAASGRAWTMSHCGTSVVEIVQWGQLGLTSTESAFQDCNNLTAVPNNTDGLKAVTDMAYMFRGAATFDSPIDRWDVSAVTSMYGMFSGARAFNQPLDSWDTSAVTDMGRMFAGARAFNRPLGNWDVSAVTNMGGMFAGATAFNRPLGNWDVSAVTNMYSMFHGATSFNQPIGGWDVSSVAHMRAMFYEAGRFFQDLSGWTIHIPHGKNERKFLKTFSEGTMLAGALLPEISNG